MKLVGFGESFTLGEHYYPDGSKPVDDRDYHKFSYIKHIQHNLNGIFSDYEIIASRGWSNLCIWNAVYKYLRTIPESDYKNLFFFICWTDPCRVYYYYDNDKDSYIGLSGEKAKIHESMWKHNLLDIQDLIYQYETQIMATHCFLTLKGIKHIMINGFSNHFAYSKYNIIKKTDNLPFWINWNKSNNTIFDIVRYAYLSEEIPELSQNDHNSFDFNLYKDLGTVSKCLHPSRYGYELIGKKLTQYVKNII